ncbi:MAG: hypothetical protein ABH815_02860 [Candidatus Omnitrophota bacterium]
MRKILCIFLFFLLACQISVFSGETEINSSVFSVAPDQDFFIIGSGEKDGIEMGDVLIVYRDGEKIAEAYIIEVRGAVAAAEILNVENNQKIQENDDIIVVKNPEVSSKREKTLSKRPNSRWTNLLGARDPGPAVKGFPQKEIKGVSRVSSEGIVQGNIITMDIQSTKNSVFSYAATVLRENGFSIVFSNRRDGLMIANKPIELSLLRELWADAKAAIGHNLVVSLDIKDNGNSSVLAASLFKEHFQKGKYVKQAVSEGSKYYTDAIDVVSKIKERSEH